MQRFSTGRKTLLGQDNNTLILLLAVNALVFVLINFLKIVYFLSDIPIEFFYRQILQWFSLTADTEQLVFRPWTVFSYMFTHERVWSLIGTLLWLWGFGFILQDLTGNQKLIPIYLYAGLAGALFFVGSTQLVPALYRNLGSTPPMLGAGAAVMGVAVATTALAPTYRIFPLINGGIPLWVLTAIFVAFDFATVASDHGGVAMAHLAGGMVGYWYIWQMRKGWDPGAWMTDFVNYVDDLCNPEKKHKGKNPQSRHFYQSSTSPFTKKSRFSQEKLDAILDKINQQGYHMLTDEEKTYLKEASQENNAE